MSHDATTDALRAIFTEGAAAPKPRHATQSGAPSRKTATRRKARSRRARLPLALAALAEGGITGNSAYAPALRGLARMGVIVKPLYFWNPLALFVFGVVVFSLAMGGTALACLSLGVMPAPVRGMLNAGPTVFALLIAGMSVVFTAIHWLRARAIGLPRWRDL